MADTANKTVFLVEDDDATRGYVREVLVQNGYTAECFSDPASALRHLAHSDRPDLILSDVNMPGMSGIELLQTIKTLLPELPFILISGLYDLASALDALRVGATDYLLKPALPEDIVRVLTRNLQVEPQPQQEAVKAALGRFLKARNLSDGNSADQLLPLFEVLGFRRFETLQHSQRVAGFALLIGSHLGLNTALLAALEIGSLLHDIGKAGIPHNVVMKPSQLNEDEWRIMKMHPLIGWELLTDFPGMQLEAQIVYSHHEWYDGGGYPRQLVRSAIPIGARIFAVADTIDAITSDRCYRKGRSLEIARYEIERMTGTQFDPQVIECLRRIADRELEAIRRRFPDLVSTTSEPEVAQSVK